MKYRGVKMDIDEIKEGFVIDTDAKANWAIKKIKEYEAERDRLLAIVQSEQAELNWKAAKINSQCEAGTGYLRTLLINYFGTVPHKETKTQESYKLLDGSLVMKKPQVKIVRPETDNDLIGYLEETQPELVETIRRPFWGDFKKNLVIGEDGKVVDMSTGEVLDFIKTEETEQSFEVK